MSASVGFIGAQRGETVGTFKLPRPLPIQQENQRQQTSFKQPTPVKKEILRPDSFWNELSQVKSQKVEERKREPATGHAFIDFELNDAQIETKVKQLTHRELQRQQTELKNIVDQRTSSLREFVETQIRSSQLSLQNLRGDLKNSIQQQNIVTNVPTQPKQHNPYSTGIDSDLKRALMTEIQETIALENLQCKPIKGIDLPLPATGQILQIEEIQGKQYHPSLPKGSLLQMLLPSELKIPSLEFLEEEDMTHMEVVVQPKKTPGQNIRETKLKREIDVNLEAEKILAKKAEDDLMKVTGEEREKTIKCMLKVLKHQVKSVEDQAAELIDHAKVQEKELEEFKMELKRKENEIFRQELQQELDMTKKIAGTYKFNSVDGEEIVERLDIAEIIVDNEVLMARVDQLLKPDQGKGYLDSGQLDPTTYTLSSTLIDDLYNQASAQLEKKKQKNKKQSHKQVTAAVIKQSHPLEKNKIRPSKSKSPIKQLKSALKNSPSKSKTQASPQKQKKQNFISNTIDMNPPMTQAEFEKIKQKRISDIHNRYQIVSFGSEKHQGEQQTSFNHQNISKSEQMLKEKRQKQLENLDKILNEEIATALKCQVQLMKDVKN